MIRIILAKCALQFYMLHSYLNRVQIIPSYVSAQKCVNTLYIRISRDNVVSLTYLILCVVFLLSLHYLQLNRLISLFCLRRTQEINNKYLPPKGEASACSQGPVSMKLHVINTVSFLESTKYGLAHEVHEPGWVLSWRYC